MVPNPDHYAIVFGIDQYRHIKPLQGARRDATEFREWLLKAPPLGGGLSPDHILPGGMLPDSASEPDFAQMRAAFRTILEKSNFGELRLGTRLYVYLSGHGVNEPRVDETGLLAFDASFNVPDRLVGAVWANLFKQAGIFDEIVLFMDCCREVDGWSLKDVNPDITLNAIAGAPRPVRRFYGYATGYKLLAREHDWGTKVYRGVFTRALLEGLAGHAADDRGIVTSDSLIEYLGWRIVEIRKPGTEQSPEFPARDPIELVHGVSRPRTKLEVALVTCPEAGFVVLGAGLEVCPVDQRQLAENVFVVELVAGRKYALAIPDVRAGVYKRTVAVSVYQESQHVDL